MSDRLFETSEEIQVKAQGVETLVGKTLDRKKITMRELAVAQAILAGFNEVFETKFSGQAWLRKIILRVREHPELTAEQHHDVIARNARAPWWRGEPSPSVIYGNDGLFERCMLTKGKPELRTRAERKSDRLRRLAGS